MPPPGDNPDPHPGFPAQGAEVDEPEADGPETDDGDVTDPDPTTDPEPSDDAESG